MMRRLLLFENITSFSPAYITLHHRHNLCSPQTDNRIVEPKNDVMAEIHVQTKKQSSSPGWIWIVVALLLIGALVYYLMNRNNQTQNNTNTVQPNASSKLYPQKRPPRPERVETIIPIVHMRSV